MFCFPSASQEGGTMKLSDTAAKLSIPSGKAEHFEWDDATAGFGLRLRKKADNSVARTWVFQYRSPKNGETKRITFGSPDTLRAKDARTHAHKLRAQVNLGHDPQVEKQNARSQARDSFKKVVAEYLERRAAQVASRQLASASYEQIECSLTKHLGDLNPHPIREITQQQIARALGKIEAGIAANRARSWLIHFFGWAMREGIVQSNPAINTNRRVEKESPRTRVLSDAELAAVWNACGDDDYGRIVRLLVLTGQRRDEIGSLTWDEIDTDANVLNLSGTRTKNGREHTVPLPPRALDILRAMKRGERAHVFGIGNGGFQGWSRAKLALDRRIAAAWPVDAKSFDHWTVHDLRRTVASGMARLNVNLPVIEKVLNHQSGSFAGIVRVYQHHEFAAEKRDALNRWAAHVVGLVEGGEEKIV